jgi:competence protein ComEC
VLLIWGVLGWIAGTLFAASQPVRADAVWLTIALASALFAFAARYRPLWGIVAAACAILRFQSLPIADAIAPWRDTGDWVTIDGIVEAVPDVRDTAVHVRIRALHLWHDGRRTPTEGVVLAHAQAGFTAAIGDRVRAGGSLITPPELDRFSYTDYLARRGVFTIMPRARVRILERAASPHFLTHVAWLRDDAERRIGAALPEPYASLLSGILLGDERGIAPEIRQAFAATSAAHIIAISGFNMAVIGGLLDGLMRRTRIPPFWGALLSIALIGLYTVFVGAGAAVVRAAVMTSVVFFGRAVRREAFLPTSLAFTILIMAVIDPYVLWDIGFTLSAFAVLGIALFAEPLGRLHDMLFRGLPAPLAVLSGFLREAVTVSLAAIIFTAPLSALYFGIASPTLLIVNALVVPFQPLIMLIGGAGALLGMLVPGAGTLLLWGAMLPLAWSVGVVRLFGQIPPLTVYLSPQAIAGVFMLIIGAALVQITAPHTSREITRMLIQRRALLLTGAVTAVIVMLTALILLSQPDGRLHLWFFDLGESAALIQTPEGAHILIDGGRYPSRLLTALGDRLPFTDRSLELLIVTGNDDARIGSLPDVLGRYTPAHTLIPAAWGDTPAVERLSTALAGIGTPITPLTDRLSFMLPDGVRLTIRDAEGETGLYIEYGLFTALLPGTLSRSGQQALIEREAVRGVSLLQLPGGGERRTLADGFAHLTAPTWIVAQGDSLNKRHRPDPEVYTQFSGARLLRTDQHGVIHIVTDGVSVFVDR